MTARECPRCRGTREVGPIVLCLDCGGEHGEICPQCHGKGYVESESRGAAGGLT